MNHSNELKKKKKKQKARKKRNHEFEKDSTL